MVSHILVSALQAIGGQAACDSALLAGPVETPASAPPAIVDPRRALEHIAEATRAVGDIEDPASAQVWFLVDRQGTVAKAQIARSTASEAADSAALIAARQFRFKPAERNGEPVCYWIRLPVRLPGTRSALLGTPSGRSAAKPTMGISVFNQ